MKRLVTATVIAGALLSPLFAGSAQASVVSSTFQVKINVGFDCTFSATDLDFGIRGVLTGNIDAASALSVTCSTGLAYKIDMDEGIGTGATLDNRLMTGPAGATAGYSLYLDNARSSVWGTSRYYGTGSGVVQTIPVYGRVFQQSTPRAGLYSDTITVTVTY